MNTMKSPLISRQSLSAPRKNSLRIDTDIYDKRVWVKRNNGTPTTLLTTSNDLVDDLKVAIVNKYPNSIGRFDDAADLSLYIEKDDIKLEPDQYVWSILDQYFPQGMSMADAFTISTETVSLPTKPLVKKPEYKERSVSPSTKTATPRRSVSHPIISPQSQTNPQAVLLLPKNFSLNNNVPVKKTEETNLHNEIKAKQEEIVKNPKSETKDKVLPSISVLVVEDNAINQAILGAFLRKRKIHYEIAKNGQEAIDKWKKGGFHLVLMDIQLPVKSGIEATKEIRHLEKINKIGVFDETELKLDKHVDEKEELNSKVFRSPVIIVALTASSNNSLDKKNALTAGCNDYLTKPVNLVWLQNKITEWGCMQALINFDHWKKNDSRLNK